MTQRIQRGHQHVWLHEFAVESPGPTCAAIGSRHFIFFVAYRSELCAGSGEEFLRKKAIWIIHIADLQECKWVVAMLLLMGFAIGTRPRRVRREISTHWFAQFLEADCAADSWSRRIRSLNSGFPRHGEAAFKLAVFISMHCLAEVYACISVWGSIKA